MPALAGVAVVALSAYSAAAIVPAGLAAALQGAAGIAGAGEAHITLAVALAVAAGLASGPLAHAVAARDLERARPLGGAFVPRIAGSAGAAAPVVSALFPG